jgi:hypothetical protein
VLWLDATEDVSTTAAAAAAATGSAAPT